MKAASGQLIALLNGNSEFLMADLFTVTLRGGEVLRWTTADLDLILGGNTFHAPQDQDTTVPILERGTTRCAVGLEVDQLELTLQTGGRVLLGGISMPRAAVNGIFDSARVKLERVFMPSWGDTSPGSVVLFEGNVAGCDPSSTAVALTIKSEIERLNVALPKYLYMPACGHTVYSAGCGLNKAYWTVTSTVAAGATTTSVPTNIPDAPDNYFNLGVVAITSGPAAGSRRSVRLYRSGVITPVIPFLVAPAAGDGLTVYPGCDHTLGGCGRFGNKTRFRGYPFVPRPETTR